MNTLSKLAVAVLLTTGCAIASAQSGSLLERGKYLVEGVVGCGNCHIARGEMGQPLFEKGLSGGMVFDEIPFKAFAANITPDKKTGIGLWTAAQLAKAIREGIRPDGRLIGPPMPMEFYRHISDEDLAAIVAYVRAQPAVEHNVPESEYRIPLPPAYGPSVVNLKTPEPADPVRYGEYLANIGHCMECHTPRDEKGMLIRSELGAGGQRFKGPWGETVSRNLTPHASGLKDWSDDQIARAVRTGTDRNGKHYRPPMGFDFYKNISDFDMRALIAYLRALPPLEFAGAK